MELRLNVMIWEFLSRGAILPFIRSRRQLIYWGTATLQDVRQRNTQRILKDKHLKREGIGRTW